MGKNNGLDKLNFDIETWLPNNYCIITIGTMYNLGLSIGDRDCLIIITVICNQFLFCLRNHNIGFILFLYSHSTKPYHGFTLVSSPLKKQSQNQLSAEMLCKHVILKGINGKPLKSIT